MHLEIAEAQLRSMLDSVSNGTPVHIEDEWIEQAGEEFKAALRKQFQPEERDFTIRMSNIGRPLCQLQKEQAGEENTRRPYNHVIRMLIGDATEAIVRLCLKAADVDVTSDGDKVELEVAGITVSGESDLDVSGLVCDVKSASPWAIRNKWTKGYPAMKADDTFGYIGQLQGYADAQGKQAGGWFVVDKSTGEIHAVSMDETPEGIQEIRKEREKKVAALLNNAPFRRCFDAVPETHYKKQTGHLKVPIICTMCDYFKSCWPDAVLEKKREAKGKTTTMVWYDS